MHSQEVLVQGTVLVDYTTSMPSYLCFVGRGAFRSGAELFLHHERIVEVLGVVHRRVNHAVFRVVGAFVVHRTVPADLDNDNDMTMTSKCNKT